MISLGGSTGTRTLDLRVKRPVFRHQSLKVAPRRMDRKSPKKSGYSAHFREKRSHLRDEGCTTGRDTSRRVGTPGVVMAWKRQPCPSSDLSHRHTWLCAAMAPAVPSPTRNAEPDASRSDDGPRSSAHSSRLGPVVPATRVRIPSGVWNVGTSAEAASAGRLLRDVAHAGGVCGMRRPARHQEPPAGPLIALTHDPPCRCPGQGSWRASAESCR